MSLTWRDRLLLGERRTRRFLGGIRRGARHWVPWVAVPATVVYQAAAVLRETGQPNTDFWSKGFGSQALPWVAFAGLVSVAYVAIEIFLSTRSEDQGLRQVMYEEFAQAFVVFFYEASNGGLPITSLAAHVHKVRKGWTQGQWLDRVAEFKLRSRIPATGIAWRPGVGAVGLAWDNREPFLLDLADVHALYAKGADLFDAATSSERFGMSAAEFAKASSYHSIYVVPLFAKQDGVLIGVATLSCTEAGHHAEMAKVIEAAGVNDPASAMEQLLRQR